MSFQYSQQAPPPEKKGTDNTLLIVGGLLALMVLGGIVVVVAYFLRPGPPAAPTEAVSFDIPTALDAYPAAVTLIRQQDAGAVLVSAAGAWTPIINTGQLQAGRTGWTYYFYLPATRQLAAVVADRAGSPRIANVQPWVTAPAVLDDQKWQQDSPAGMIDFMQKCGGDLGAQPDREVIARFSTAAENNFLVWHYQVVSPDQQVVCQLSIDGTTGQIR